MWRRMRSARSSSALRPGRPLRAKLAALALLAAATASAAPSTSGIDARYRASVAGVPIAELALAVAEGDRTARARLAMESVGLAAAWSGARSELAALIRRDGAGPPLPVRFDSRLSKRDRERTVSIRYDPRGAIAGLEITSQGRPRKSEVPPELRLGTVDPLTAFERLRAWLPEAAQGRAPALVTVPIFDGRKRLDLEARYVGRVPAGEEGEAHELAVRLVGIFGFDEDDSFIQLPDGEEPAPLRVLVRADGGLLPLRIDVPTRRTGPVIELVRDCQKTRCPPSGG